MKLHPLFLLALVAPLSSCSQSPASSAVAPVAAPVPAPATAAGAPTPVPTSPPPPPAPAPAPAPAATAATVTEGTDYTVVPGGAPLEPGKAKVEVVEFFNYICPACNAFNPLLTQWKARQGPDVRLVYVPADFRPDFAPYARAYYAAEALGLVGKTHEAVYRAIHQTHTLPAEGSVPDEGRIAAFYAQYGTGASVFEGAMHSFAVDARLRQGHDFMVRSQVQGTPSLLVNGRYLVLGHSFEDKLRIADALVARERAKP